MDWEVVAGLLQSFVPTEDILKILDMIPTRLDRACRAQKKMSFFRFSEQQYALGRAEILRLQMECAENGKGNPRVLIWLGMQHCGQSMRTAQIYKPKGATPPIPSTPKPHNFLTPDGKNAIVPITEPVKAEVAHQKKADIEVESILMEEAQAELLEPNLPHASPAALQAICAHTGKPLDG